jgi:hypothetical protein
VNSPYKPNAELKYSEVVVPIENNTRKGRGPPS